MDDDALITWVGDDFPGPIQAIAERVLPGRIPEVIVEQGWWPLLVRLDRRLTAIDPEYMIRQVLPVDGRLRFEVEDSPFARELRAIIHDAEDESARTCEACGRPGRRRSTYHPWYEVLCDEDAGLR